MSFYIFRLKVAAKCIVLINFYAFYARLLSKQEYKEKIIHNAYTLFLCGFHRNKSFIFPGRLQRRMVCRWWFPCQPLMKFRKFLFCHHLARPRVLAINRQIPPLPPSSSLLSSKHRPKLQRIRTRFNRGPLVHDLPLISLTLSCYL